MKPENTEISQAIGYVRVSTQEQADQGVSLAAQREKIGQYCQLHGLALAATFADEGLSAKRADNRPGLADALTAACDARAALVVYSLSRLARSTTDAIGIAERLSKAGANLVSITERIDTTTGMGRFFFTTIAALAQLERDQISERTAMALAHKRAKGERVGSVPYGYRLGADAGMLVPDDTERETIETIRRLRATGLSARQIIVELKHMNLRPKRGGRWHVKVVLSLCEREQTLHERKDSR